MQALRCRPLALLMLVVFLAGCYSWRPTTVSPRQVIEEEQPSRVRVTLNSGTVTVIPDPVLVGDSIIPLEELQCQSGYTPTTRTSVLGRLLQLRLATCIPSKSDGAMPSLRSL